MPEKKLFAVIAFILLLLPQANAISALDAIKTVRDEGHFLLENETVEQPVSPVTLGEEKFWVVPVVIEDNVVTYFVVDYTKKEISENDVKNREAIGIAHFLKEYIKLRQRFSDSASNEWVISSAVSRTFASMVQVIENKYFELNLIETQINSAEIRRNVSAAKQKLSTLSTQCGIISETIQDAALAENDFIESPSEKNKVVLISGTELLSEQSQELSEMIQDYAEKTNELKQEISISKDPDAEAIIRYGYANSPEELLTIQKYLSDAEAMKQNIDSIQKSISGNAGIDFFVQVMKSRIQRNETINLIQGQDAKIKKELNLSDNSISKLVSTILDDKYKAEWIEQPLVEKMEIEWNKANKYIQDEKFAEAKTFALKARDDAIEVYNAGTVKPKPNQLLTTELAIYIGGALLLLLGIVYLIKNKEKFFPSEKNE